MSVSMVIMSCGWSSSHTNTRVSWHAAGVGDIYKLLIQAILSGPKLWTHWQICCVHLEVAQAQ